MLTLPVLIGMNACSIENINIAGRKFMPKIEACINTNTIMIYDNEWKLRSLWWWGWSVENIS